MFSRRLLSVLLLVVPLAGSTPGQNIRYVDDDSPAVGNGMCWSVAYQDLQDALDEALSDPTITEIRVASGTYVPTRRLDPDTPRTEVFQLVNGVRISGGYRGCPGGDGASGNSDDRDIALYESILSGDLNGDDDASDFPFGPSFSENCYHVFYHPEGLSLGETAVLDGFTITGGSADGVDTHRRGGGMFNFHSSPTVVDCTFNQNSAYHGGGIYSRYSTPTVASCTFNGNSAGNGGGMGSAASNPTVKNCTFNRNSAGDGGGMYNNNCNTKLTDSTFSGNASSGQGGGMSNYSCSESTVSNCTFIGNTADWGGGIYNYDSSPTVTDCTFSGNTTSGNGGGMYNSHSSMPAVAICTFSGNSAGWGGGMFNYDESNPIVANCAFSRNSAQHSGGGMNNYDDSSPTVRDCTFIGNSADYGGGMFNCSYSDPTVTNCMFSGNSAGYGGGMCGRYYSSSTVTNCTFCGNSASSGQAIACHSIHEHYPSTVLIANCILWDGGDEIWNNDGSTITVTYSDVQDDEPDDDIVHPGTGNIDTDPLFIATGYWDDGATPDDPNDDFWVDGNYRLQAESPCINSGDNSVVPDDILTDLDGHARILCGQVDMGAYEFGIGDYDCDQTVNLVDFTDWQTCMTGPDSRPYIANCEAFDFEYDLDVDIRDFARFQGIFEGPQP